ncbi:hypothetical protein ES332_D01G065100v1 [Gossypium tomentosum]|uniref:Uncharacterized protein n=1 Tax=Gossypium tomentosum TaxID=34277 RepID=A0A5D2M5W6_GOSTO|nr:hypothetical protein ES332_D01G065100v1 [Gossypium tomentosum]
MDLSAVLSVVKTIGNLITEEARLLGGKDQVESSLGELKLMRSFLKEADSRKVYNDRELAYDAEDVIETFAPKVTLKKKGGISNAIKRSACFLKEGRVLHETKSKIEKITARIKELTRELRTYNLRRLGERGDSKWQMVFENVKTYLKRGKGLCIEDVSCFLYLSIFPEDYEIPVERLIQLWVAEGLVSSAEGGEGNGGEMMEDVAEGCLVELVERCMVQVGERGPTLKIKTYRMHDLMRGLCLSVAKKENFVCIIDDLHPLDNDDCSLLMVVLGVFLLWKRQGCWTYLFNNFKLLRVLECEACENVAGCKFLNLRAFDFIIPKIPSSLGNLRCLQTLDLKYPAYSGFCCVPDFNTYNCFLADRSKFTKLRKLEIFGSLHIEDCKEGLDKNLSIITSKYLQSLSIDGGGIDPKLLVFLLSSCVYLCELILDGKMRMLPEYHRFPSSTAYDSLTLKELVNLEEWKVEEGAMPALHHLKIEYCETLKLEY